jgi:Lon-like protease
MESPRLPAPTWQPARPAGAPPPAPHQAVPQVVHWRTAVLLVSAFATVLLGSVLMLLPVPFVVLQPGPAINTLGTESGHPLISVSGHASYAANGALDLTTVTVSGGPGSRLLLFDALSAWFDGTRTVAPQDLIYPPGESVQTSLAQDHQDMVTSQESATVAALHELGIQVPTTLTVDSVDTPASTPLRAKDVIVAIGGVPVPDMDSLLARIRQTKAGTTLAVTVRRGGADVVVQAPTHSASGHTVLGIRLDPTFHPPFQVTIRIDNVGGPSAGTMFALGIIDLLTPGDMTNGQKIAGTGTIDVDGAVGPIGGIVQKMYGARAAKATWFLAPADNCTDVRGHIPDGLKVVKISTLKQAHQAVEQIAAGQGATLTGCG